MADAAGQRGGDDRRSSLAGVAGQSDRGGAAGSVLPVRQLQDCRGAHQYGAESDDGFVVRWGRALSLAGAVAMSFRDFNFRDFLLLLGVAMSVTILAGFPFSARGEVPRINEASTYADTIVNAPIVSVDEFGNVGFAVIPAGTGIVRVGLFTADAVITSSMHLTSATIPTGGLIIGTSNSHLSMDGVPLASVNWGSFQTWNAPGVSESIPFFPLVFDLSAWNAADALTPIVRAWSLGPVQYGTPFAADGTTSIILPAADYTQMVLDDANHFVDSFGTRFRVVGVYDFFTP